jgi:hypothetical protein
MRPADDEVPPWFRSYVALVPGEDPLNALSDQADALAAVAAEVPPDRESWAYASGKWTVRQVFGHLVDAERVLGFRAFCFGRGEAAALPAFDEDAYVERSHSADVPLSEHLAEFRLLREANLLMLRRLDDAAWSRRGIASGATISVRALAFGLAGHLRHHLAVLAERYGISAAPAGPDWFDHYVRGLDGPVADDSWHRLREAGPALLPRLLGAFRAASRPEVRLALLRLVNEVRSPAAAPFLAARLFENDEDLLKTALDGLVTLGGEAVRDLLAALRCHLPPGRAEWAAEALEQVEERIADPDS